MISNNGWTDYKQAILKEAQTKALLSMAQEYDQMTELTRNLLFDKEGPIYLEKEQNPSEKRFMKIFYGYMEIERSLEFMNDVVIYIRSFPHTKTDISRIRYLEYHIGSYLNELYIFSERLDTYLTVIERIYKANDNDGQIKYTIKSVKKIVEKTLKRPVQTRGAHVHEARYRDRDLRKLETIELLFTASETPVISKWYYDHNYREIRKKWVKNIIDNNQALQLLLDTCFKSVYKIVFDENGNMR